MSAVLDRYAMLTPAEAAAMLHARGVGPDQVARDTALADALSRILIEANIRLGRAPDDFPAVRAALADLTRVETR